MLSLASSRQCCRSAKPKSARSNYKDHPSPLHNSIHAHAAWQNLSTLPPRSTTSTPEPAAKPPSVWHHRRSQPAISCLGAFRPPAIGVRGETVIPAAENLHISGSLTTLFLAFGRRGAKQLIAKCGGV